MAASKKTDAFLKRVREGALAKYPGAHLKSPWPDHLDLAVNDKTFAYLSREGQPLGVGCKLPHSNALALMLPNVEPAGYGLGKSGWVSAKFADDELPPIDMIEAWIDESYRAQAPKKLIAQLDGRVAPAIAPRAAEKTARPATKKAVTKKAATKKTPTKKAARKSG
ncbi:MAG: MmcQ/YjbR family DNA-binding protein [Myxococcota bacterium]|nr:MmcQ/YjbR family DNA-binding protein [Myxococcota bacterium]